MTAVDPVCKVKIAEQEAHFVSNYRGAKYYFCAAPCKRDFDDPPDDFVQ